MSQNRLNGKSLKNVIVIEKSQLNDAIKDGKNIESLFVLKNCDIKLDNIQSSTLNQGKPYGIIMIIIIINIIVSCISVFVGSTFT